MRLARTLRRLAAEGQLRHIDVELAVRLGELAGRQTAAGGGAAPAFDEAGCLAGLLASRAIDAGHSCIPLAACERELAGLPWPDGPSAQERPAAPDAAALAALEAAGVLGREAGAVPCPLVVEHERLYLQRYAALEQECAERLAARLTAAPDALTTERLHPGSPDYLFEATDSRLAGATNWQAVACAVALRHPLSVLSGGPGTGKTWTLAMIALLLLERARQNEGPYRIALAAPTGKAAQRLRESLAAGLAAFRERFDVRAEDLAYLGNSGKTIHRLLGYRPDRVEFRHDAATPLEAECVVVDECSMVDLPLFTRLLRALRPETRLILVGDRQQLFPVEAGSVFAELFSLCGTNRFDADTAAAIAAACAIDVATEPALAEHLLAGRVTCLEHSFRAERRIAAISATIQACEEGPEAARELVETLSPGDDEARLLAVSAREAAGRVAERCEGGWFSALRAATTPQAALTALGRLRILCALRRGPLGVTGLNAAVEAALFANPALLAQHYHGRPILITRNDYRLRLFNGDIGVIFEEAVDGELRPRACFPGAEGEGLRRFTPSQLPPHETCYAMTIHKSQGSEFDHVVVVLPGPDDEAGQRLLTRELLYTGITRARRALELWSDPELLARAAMRGTRRYSALPERFRGLRGTP